MKVHIVLFVMGGVPEDPKVFLEREKADVRYEELCKANDLDPEDPHTDDADVYQWEVEVDE